MRDQETQAEAQPEPAADPVGDSAWDTLDFVPSDKPDPANVAVEPLTYDSL